MQTKPLLLLALLLAGCSCALVSCSLLDHLTQSFSEQAHLIQQAAARLPALFDFNQYQELFDKQYKSRVEAAARQLYFMASAVQVYFQALAYQTRQASHYLALNHLSDLSRQELDGMLNKVMMAAHADQASELADEEAEPEVDGPAEPADVLDEVEDGVRQVLASVAETGQEGRSLKCGLSGCASLDAVRVLPLDKLIQSGRRRAQPEAAKPKAKAEPRGGFQDPIPMTSTTTTKSLTEQQTKVKLYRLKWLPTEPAGDKGVRRRKSLQKNNDNKQQLPDEMFVDLRQSGCMLPPRDQGRECGACYAFAGITMAEFLVCKSTGRLAALSEQYVIDCGKGRFPGMEGCAGGNDENLPHFIHNFGLELRVHYPYLGRESHCPYANNSDLQTTGFVRMHLDSFLFVPVQFWPEVLKSSPIYVGIAVPADFFLYGGGVDDGVKCPARPNHAMVVVGHGREDGKEFWLIRNSHGVNWGQGGYYKLAKSAPERCIENQEGFVYGTKDAVEYKARAHMNGAHPVASLVLEELELRRQREATAGDQSARLHKNKLSTTH